MKQLLYFLCTIFVLSSCNWLAKTGYGAKKPKVENQASIQKWLERHKLVSEPVVTINPEKYYNYFPGYAQAPFLFDRGTGNYAAVGMSNGQFCPKNIDLVFASIAPYYFLRQKPDSFLITEALVNENGKVEKLTDTTILQLSRFTEAMHDLNGNPFNVGDLKSCDYVLILPFALFLGNRLQVKDLKKYYAAAKSNKNSRIQILFLNFDKQQWWQR